MLTSSFVVHLFILQNILCTINILCNKFQEKNGTLGKAAYLIKSVILIFENGRSALAFNNLCLQIKNFPQDYNIELDTVIETQSK